MSDPKLANIPASVRQKLLNLARERNEDFQLLLTKYGLGRVLFRLSTSKHRDIFILKGALLFELWTHELYRPTRDADFLATGDNSPERFAAIFREICTAEITDDGILFDPASVRAERIKEDADYEGVRVAFTGTLDKAQNRYRSTWDSVTPSPRVRFERNIRHCLDFRILICSPIRGKRSSPKSSKRWSSSESQTAA
jgi:nucleotidyltransferase AbiEii toxin of type IV toxin-antitoxin system